MNNISIEYIAGLFDGEGSVLIKGGSDSMISPQVRISGSYINTLEEIKNVLGGKIYSVSRADNLNDGNKFTYCWTVTSYDKCLNILEILSPYCREKKLQVDLAIEAIKFAKSLPNRNRSTDQIEKLSYYKSELKKLKKYGCRIK